MLNLTTAGLAEILSRPPAGIAPPASLNHITPRPTDVKVLLSQLGRSRRMAFVGYKSPEQAAWVLDVWQGVWVHGPSSTGSGSHISVQWAKGIEESGKSRAHPIASEESSLLPPPKKKSKLDATNKPEDPQFAEFMALANPRKHKSLVNDIMDLPVSIPPNPAPALHPQEPVRTESPPVDPDDQASSRRASSSPPPVIGDDDEITDKEYLARRMKRKLTDTLLDLEPRTETAASAPKEWDQDDDEGKMDHEQPPVNQRPKVPSQPKHLPPEPALSSDQATILESGRLFLRNLAFSVTEEEIRALFEPFGTVAQVHILLDHARNPKGLGYVSFSRPADALEAYRKLDQHDFQGRLLHILPAVTRNSRTDSSTTASKGKNSVKLEQDAKRKLESSKQFNWATLYMNSDAVASSVAARLKIGKAELFSPDAVNPAVKLALAETHVIQETKQFLEDSGVNVSAFEEGMKAARSPTTILVKNMPFDTPATVIKALFSEHGAVSKVLVPPSGTIAVVEMADKEDAKSAFRGLAYKRIGNSVLYLEKAPLDLWKPDHPAKPLAAAATTVTPATQEEESGEPGSTLFVKNLSFGTAPEALALRFSSLAGFLFARIQTKPDPKHPVHRLSMGFGFVGFRTAQQAQQALQRMQGCHLDGHTLQLKFANRGREREEEEEKEEKKGAGKEKEKAASNKLLVKNLPFEVTKKELAELFGVYGKLKSVRLPKKLDRKSRGFAFVEFHTKKEAQEARNSLKFSHLLGRHLVIEFANDADAALDLESLRNSQSAFLKLQSSHQKKKFAGLAATDDADHDDQEGMED
ncbi:hypothetical protein PCASD_13674 [Puccinia coronata f. sp. avenae]|uniref:RRM domain-containing protein n=1 Tax=Puccinia coronata f. sp. avenae TaxID=200324 RepID=A0A2N5UC28_9BASI|nr:hypothetical protein PCASD_13674 [Puccinia coronata f. sp. avenae]